MEGYLNLYENEDRSGNRPHFKATFKIGEVWHEAALWPAREGKKGFSGKYKAQGKAVSKETQAELEKLYQEPTPPTVTSTLLDDEIPF